MMSLNTKVKKMRKIKGFSQEEMAHKINISRSTYGRIERGETSLTEQKLEKIASIFDIDDWTKIKTIAEDKILLLLAENNTIESSNSEQFETVETIQNMNFHYYGNENFKAEIEKLNLIIQHKEEIIKQKEVENQLLRDLVDTLKSK